MFTTTIKGSKPSWFSKVGEKDSLYIYILHILVIMANQSVVKRMPSDIGIIYEWISPIVVTGLTIFLVRTLCTFKVIRQE